MKVIHTFSNKYHFFKVESKENVYNVSVKLNCDCPFMSVQGQANNKICKHIKEVLKKMCDVL